MASPFAAPNAFAEDPDFARLVSFTVGSLVAAVLTTAVLAALVP